MIKYSITVFCWLSLQVLVTSGNVVKENTDDIHLKLKCESEDAKNFHLNIDIPKSRMVQESPDSTSKRLATLSNDPEKTLISVRQIVRTDYEQLPWWKTSIIYQIYPRSFMDSDADGTGDLKGITSRVKYLKSLGIGAVWLSPIYVSPMADFGYDVANFTDIDPIFGTLEDFDELLMELHANGLKLIMDFIPNHTSDKHQWFEKSIQKIEPYTDYYVWRDPKGYDSEGRPIPPNNWLSVFRYSAWEWSEQREQFYLHQFLKEQPDLNVRNPAVLQELNDVVKFWFDRGVDGYRIDALKHMFEVEDMNQDEPLDTQSGAPDPDEYHYLNHTLTVNQPETVDATRTWREIADSYDGDRMIMVEIYDGTIEEIMKYYGNETDLVSHFPFNFYFITDLMGRDDITGRNVQDTIDIWLENMPEGKWPNWVLGNHDRSRVASRLGEDLVDAMNMLSLLLPGTPTTYYGEEIGMEDTFVTFAEVKDPFGLNFGPERYEEFGRDPGRSPMQWNAEHQAGFTNGNSTWLPINANYQTLNVANQEKAQQSHLKVYKLLAALRQEKPFTHGHFDYALVNDDLLSFARYLDEKSTYYLVIINTSKQSKVINLLKEETPSLSFKLGASGTVEVRSSFDTRQETQIGSVIDLSKLSLLGGEGLVVKMEMEES